MIELKNISFVVDDCGNKKVILNNISCVFDDGGVTAITGHNGSGKSTLTKIIMGIIAPTSGEIFFNGRNITNMTITERANLGINYAFQQPVAFSGITVKDLIDIATKEKNSVPKACKYLSMVGLCAKEYLNREFDKSLSGGEQKRIELALAIAKKGDCVIFDEPEAGIDLWSFDKLSEVMDNQKSYIIVSHQEKLLKKSDKILVLNKGEIVAYDSAKKVLKNLPKVCGKINGGAQ